jgi:hypothetical protein
MNLFEYIFYRIAKFFYRGDGSAAIRAVAILSLVQILLVVDFFLLIRILSLQQSDVQGYAKFGRLFGGIIALVIVTLNTFHFRGKYWRLADRWRQAEEENPNLHGLRGWLVILAVILPFALFLLPFLIH